MNSRGRAKPSDGAKRFLREWLPIGFGLVGSALAIAGWVRAEDAESRADRAEERLVKAEELARTIQAEKLLLEAWDHLGGAPGTTVITSFVDVPQELELARRKIAEALQIDQDNARAHRVQGVYLEASGQIDKAIEAYQRALDIEESPRTLLNLAIALSEKGESEESLDTLMRALELAGNDPLVYLNLAGLLLREDQESEADVAFQKAVVLLHQRRELLSADELDDLVRAWRSDKGAFIHNLHQPRPRMRYWREANLRPRMRPKVNESAELN